MEKVVWKIGEEEDKKIFIETINLKHGRDYVKGGKLCIKN